MWRGIQSFKMSNMAPKLFVELKTYSENILLYEENIIGKRCISKLDITADRPLTPKDWNNTAELFSLDGQLLSSLQLSQEPRDVAVVDKSISAISTWNNQVVILDIGHRGQLSVREISKLKPGLGNHCL